MADERSGGERGQDLPQEISLTIAEYQQAHNAASYRLLTQLTEEAVHEAAVLKNIFDILNPDQSDVRYPVLLIAERLDGARERQEDVDLNLEYKRLAVFGRAVDKVISFQVGNMQGAAHPMLLTWARDFASMPDLTEAAKTHLAAYLDELTEPGNRGT